MADGQQEISQVDVDQAVRAAILEALKSYKHPAQILMLAEASAWVHSTAQPHGGHNFGS